jgi:CBS-domain-containing membrane protein
MEDTVICYEERAQAQRRDLNVQVQEFHESIDIQGQDLKATLDTQGQQSMASMQRQEDWMACLEQAIANIANNQSHS